MQKNGWERVKLDKKTFALLLSKLGIAKQVEVTPEILSVYWEDTHKLNLLESTLVEARRTPFRGRFPTIDEIVSLNKTLNRRNYSISKKKIAEETLKLKPNSNDYETRFNFLFALDCMRYLGIKSDFIFDAISDKKLKLPSQYFKKYKFDSDEVIALLGDIYNVAPRVKNNLFVVKK